MSDLTQQCEDWSLKAMIALELSGLNILETNVEEEQSPLPHDINADYPAGAECTSGGWIWRRTGANPTVKIRPGLLVGKWIITDAVQYSTASQGWYSTITPKKNQYVHRNLTVLEKGADTFMYYGRWQAKANLATGTALPALVHTNGVVDEIASSNSDWEFIEKSGDWFFKTPLWIDKNYDVGSIVWVPDHDIYNPHIGIGAIANDAIIKDPNNPYIYKPRKRVEGEQTTGDEWEKIGETNQYRLLNASPASITTQQDEIYYKLLIQDSYKELAFENVDAEEIEVIMTDITETIEHHNQVYDMSYQPNDQYEYWFNHDQSESQLLIEGLPRYSQSILTIRIKNPNKLAALGALYIGTFEVLGHLESVGAGGSGFSKIRNKEIIGAASLGSFSHSLKIQNDNYNFYQRIMKKIIKAGAEKRPTFFKPTGHLTEAWGAALLDDYFPTTQNNGLEFSVDRLDIKEVY